jgi:hypothetical protein
MDLGVVETPVKNRGVVRCEMILHFGGLGAFVAERAGTVIRVR